MHSGHDRQLTLASLGALSTVMLRGQEATLPYLNAVAMLAQYPDESCSSLWFFNILHKHSVLLINLLEDRGQTAGRSSHALYSKCVCQGSF